MLCSISTKLGSQELEEIKSLEQQLGKTLLSFTCHEVKPTEVSEDQLEKIRNLENRIGVSLIAV